MIQLSELFIRIYNKLFIDNQSFNFTTNPPNITTGQQSSVINNNSHPRNTYSNTLLFYDKALIHTDLEHLNYNVRSVNVLVYGNLGLEYSGERSSPQFVTKQIYFSNQTYDKIAGIACFIHEICMQYYAYTVLKSLQLPPTNTESVVRSKSATNVSQAVESIVIPQIYKVSQTTINGDCSITVLMEYLPPADIDLIHKIINSKGYDFIQKWDGIIQTFFVELAKHKILHLDTKYGNVFFTKVGKNGPLQIG